MNKKTILLTIFALLLASCTTTNINTGYYWGNYSQTLYKLKTSPGDNSLKKHIEELQSIIDYSEKNTIRVPPGIHAELGYRLAQTNQNSRAKAELNKETVTYPESKPFIDRVSIFLGLDN